MALKGRKDRREGGQKQWKERREGGRKERREEEEKGKDYKSNTVVVITVGLLGLF